MPYQPKGGKKGIGRAHKGKRKASALVDNAVTLVTASTDATVVMPTVQPEPLPSPLMAAAIANEKVANADDDEDSIVDDYLEVEEVKVVDKNALQKALLDKEHAMRMSVAYL